MTRTSTTHPWMKEYNEASKFTDDINGMISEMNTTSGLTLELEHQFTAILRNITVLKTKLSGLEIQLSGLYGEHNITKEEMNRLNDMLSIMRSKTNQMEIALNRSHIANIDSSISPEITPVDATMSTEGLGKVVRFQQQIVREQDDALDELAETVSSIKHVALAMNEELGLHRRLIDSFDYNAEIRRSWVQDIQRGLAVLNKRTKSGCCSLLCLSLSLLGLLILILLVIILIKYMQNHLTLFGSHLSNVWED